MSHANDAVNIGSQPSADAEVEQLLHPSLFYARPADVVADELLTIGERRAILSSWASDACAVDSNPPLRRPPLTGAPITFDEIMDALQELDWLQARPPGAQATRRHRSRGGAAQVWQPHGR
jgi:hypothetical protein